MTKKRKPRLRTELRALSRERDKLFEARAKLALLEAGGTPKRPIEVRSASVIESRAESEPCLRCGAAVRCEEHTTESTPSGLLRVVRLHCPACGAERHLYFRIVASTLH